MEDIALGLVSAKGIATQTASVWSRDWWS